MRTLVVTVATVMALALAAASAAATRDTPAKMRTIVRAWSARLNANDNAGTASLFGVPAIMRQGDLAYRLTSVGALAMWHEGLPCGGTISRIIVRGRFATAVFTLGQRKGHKCDAPGVEAAARFEITHGKIRSWTQVAVPPPAGQTA